MRDEQWKTLLNVISGEEISPLPVGFVVDSPWLPNWYGVKILDYFSNDEIWFRANKAIHDMFPEILFLPGFWSEFGMCTEPSAFGARSSFPLNEFPHAHRVILTPEDIGSLHTPNPEVDGLLPFMMNRLKLCRERIENSGHAIRFAVARGPLNIASYLMGTTEFLTLMMIKPVAAHSLIRKITDFLHAWLDLQCRTFPTIDGIFLLDDIIGFLGEDQFITFAKPYFSELFQKDVSVRFLHNDAPCRVSSPHLADMGVNLFNMGFDVSLGELQELTSGRVALVGNLPPRDVLACGDTEIIAAKSAELVASLKKTTGVVFSCGGGMPPGVSNQAISTFCQTVSRG